MPKVPFFRQSGEPLDPMELSDAIFGQDLSEGLLYYVVKGYMGNKRRGTACTKDRSEVRGGGRKPWRQKGTGRARHGSIRSPIWRGGGVVFGPKPRSFYTKMSKKIRRKALLQVLSQKAKDLEILGVDSLNFEKPKTKDFVKMLNAIGLKEGKILFVLDERNPNVEKSVSNLKRCSLISFRDLNALDVLRSDRVVFTRGALEKFCEVAAGYASSV